MIISLSKIVRMPAGTTQTYLLAQGDAVKFLKKLSIYTLRSKAIIDHESWVAVRLRDDTVQRMVIVKVINPGIGLKKRGRKKHAEKD